MPDNNEKGHEPTLADHVYDRLLQDIIDGLYPVSHRLPSETLLSKSCGVSRPVLREALARLREDGIISTRQGSGNYVAQRPDHSVGAIVPLGSISDIQRCYEFRIDIEPLCAGWAALRRTDEQVAELERAIDRFNKTYLAHDPGAEADLEIHMVIARSTGNPFHITAMEMMARQIAFGMHLSRSLTLRAATPRNTLVEEEHAAVFEAIREQNEDAARTAMKRHLINARDRMFVGSR